MYADHFGFREMPFSILPDPRFLYLSKAHGMALSMLEYGVLNQAGFTVVTGEIGSGKTTLIRHLLRNVGDNLNIALINHTPREDDNLLEWLLLAFDQPAPPGESHAVLRRRFCDFVRDVAANGGRAMLIIDEAQNLMPSTLEELRMLSNMNDAVMMLQLILVGQPELSYTLSAPALRQFALRISSDFHLPPLQPAEVNQYICHRLECVGGHAGIIKRGARWLIAEETNGIPRQINILAERCLAYAYGRGLASVSRRLVCDVIGDRQRHGVFRFDPQLARAEPAYGARL
ncbi:AAA family ATPase [Corticibacterium sp. UT-5YL-CI-8]|nr:AAA family ATPase [Tianweitania sp. UT-5YL-CI-8]